MRPRPKNVSRLANIAPTFAGNFLAMMVKLEVRNAEFPTASMILMRKLRAMKTLGLSKLSSNPKRMEQEPVVKMPRLNTRRAPHALILDPMIGLAMKTVSSNMPKTRPYSTRGDKEGN